MKRLSKNVLMEAELPDGKRVIITNTASSSLVQAFNNAFNRINNGEELRRKPRQTEVIKN